MHEQGSGLDITEQLQVVDWLKAELVSAAGAVLRASLARDPGRVLEALAALQITLYALARRWGVPLARLEQEVTRRLEREARSGHYLESRFGDLTAIRQHLERRAGSS
ncbi:MAG TPA: MazG-like family protein [Thermaerobacter sp.]